MGVHERSKRALCRLCKEAMIRLSAVWRSCAILFAVASFVPCEGLCQQWQPRGSVVQFSNSKIELLSVRSDWTSDFDYTAGRPGPIYFNDCVAFMNRAPVAATHIQFVFAAVDNGGIMRRPPLPLDIHYRANSGAKYTENANCRNYGYANGDRGLWLVGWVNRVDFADGTSWTAPTGDALTEAIRDALPSSQSM